jgi:hypothetical protein
MIPSVVELVVKPFLYDIFFRIESISKEGWNDDTINLSKRASIEIHGMNNPLFDKSGKNLEMRMRILMKILTPSLNWVSLPLKEKKQLSFLRYVGVILKTKMVMA